MKLFFRVQYRGNAFAGWQRQSNSFTVQECIEERLRTLYGKPITLFAASRTDSGVHAMGQMMSFEVETTLTPDATRERINQVLPESVYLTHGWEVEPHAHVIQSAKWKHYRYLMYRHGRRSPLYDERAWVNNWDLDLRSMKRATGFLRGTHDFTSFKAADGLSLTSVRTMYKCLLTEKRDWIVFDFIGNGFLKNMVRNIVGTVVHIGMGKMDPIHIPNILEARDRQAAGPCAPASGLYLMHVHYPLSVFRR